MPKYLVDVNLPCYIGKWKEPDFISQIDIDRAGDDDDIWDYSIANDLTIITKDADFQDKILFHTPPPRVIWIRLGNLKLNPFRMFLEYHWETIKTLSDTHKLVIVYLNRIEGIA